jgi:endonuclease/exonuclease/phosphatase (EEP) superfamily protein YafD
MVGAPVAVALLVIARRWVLSAVAACLTAALVVVQLPLYVGSESTAEPTASIRVLTANLGMGKADPVALTASAGQSAEVLVVQELTSEAATGLSAAGLDDAFPHRVLDPRPAASGIGIWSRYPLTESAAIDGYSLPMLRTRVQVPGLAIGPTVVAVHIAAPWPQPIDGWQQDMDRYPDLLRSLAADPGTVIVAGDFNATMDMRPLRRLLDAGYRDAAEQAGAGLARTYPNRDGRPAVLGIDHILLHEATAAAAHTVGLGGSDHRALLATIVLP